MVECVICMEILEDDDFTPLPNCKHDIFHRACLEKCFKAECPLCRAPHNIEVFGKPLPPDDSIPPEIFLDIFDFSPIRLFYEYQLIRPIPRFDLVEEIDSSEDYSESGSEDYSEEEPMTNDIFADW